MDKNQTTGLLLIAMMVIGYFTFFAPERATDSSNKTNSTTKNTETITSKSQIPKNTNIVDSLSEQQTDSSLNFDKYGIFATSVHGTSQTVVLENENIKISFDSKGAIIKEVILKKFESAHQKPVQLLSPENNKFSTTITHFGKLIDVNDLYYEVSRSDNNKQTIEFSLLTPKGGKIKHRYSLMPNSYEIDYKLFLENLDEQITKDEIVFRWQKQMIIQEKDITLSREHSTVNYFSIEKGFDELSERSTSLEEEVINEPLKWITIKQRFFLSSLIANHSFNKGKISTNVDLENSQVVKSADVTLELSMNDLKKKDHFYTYYFGPNDYHLTKNVVEGFSNNLFLGWPPMLWVNKYVIIPLFDLLNNMIDNYGLIIILIVFIIKLFLSPLSYKSYLSMAKMKVLKPELDEIKEKHDGDMTKTQQEQMKLYQQVGVNPVSGCIPMLLQMPILLAMFYFFPQSIELRGKSFLWADDLSNFDSIATLPFEIPFYGNHISLFVLLMTLSTVLITYSQQQVSTVQGPMKTMSYILPVVFMFVLNSYPAALSFYYFISNLVTFGQQTFIKKFVDEEKIRKILDDNKKNAGNKKKSKFQQRLEDAMKAQAQKKKKK